MELYAILGVEKGASTALIGEAYRKLSKQYHPDVNKDPEAAEKFKLIAEAFEVLNDPEKRVKYDETGYWDKASNSPRMMALNAVAGIINQIIQSCVQNDIDPSTRDLISETRKSLTEQVAESKQAVKRLNRAKAYVEEAASRFKGDEDGVLAKIVRAPLIQIQGGIEARTKDIALKEQAIELIKGVSFDFEGGGWPPSGSAVWFKMDNGRMSLGAFVKKLEEDKDANDKAKDSD